MFSDGSERPSVGRLSEPLVAHLLAEASRYRVLASRSKRGAVLIDAGAKAVGGVEAGLLIAEICMGGLGSVGFAPNGPAPNWPWTIHVRSGDPVLACLGSQYAGWSLESKDKSWRGMGSGPARAAAADEDLFEEMKYRDRPRRTVMVLESGEPPPEDVIASVATAALCPAERLTFIYAPTSSLAGCAQVVARVLEVALHKAHALGFPLDRIVDGYGAAPMPPPSPDGLTAMGRTNDAIIYGGRVHLFVRGSDEEARVLTEGLPSLAAGGYGRPFREVFAEAGGDFYKIDSMLFSPAEAVVTALDSGRTWRAGRIAPGLLDASFD